MRNRPTPHAALSLGLAALLMLATPVAGADDASADRAARKAQVRAELEALSPEERQARIEEMRSQRQARVAERRAQARERFESMTPEQQAEARERFQQRREHRRQRPAQPQ